MIYISNELSHHGIKGMKWGVRKDPYTKDQIRQRRKELIDQAPSSNGKRRSSSSSPTKGYWRNASDAQISRLMDYEAKQAKKSNKKPMSTAKKVAIGLAVTAAAAGLTYAAIKSGKVQQIARGASRLAKSRKSKPMSGYELRKMGISTFEPRTLEVPRSSVTRAGANRNTARMNYYNRHGTAYSKSNITRARKLQEYSNKNYTDYGRSLYKVDRAQKAYDKNMDLFKRYSSNPNATKSGKEILSNNVINSRTRADQARNSYQEALGRSYATNNFARTKSIKYRKLSG